MVDSNEMYRNLLAPLLGLGVALISQLAIAQQSATYNFEVSPVLGRMLPYDINGASHTMPTYGLRVATPINSGALEAGALYTIKGSDKVYTGDFGYRYESSVESLNFILNLGVHYSKFSLSVDRNAAELCEPADCSTDSGGYFGLYFGGGLQLPLSPMIPLRLTMRFYKNPQIWLLLEAGLGVRF